MLPDRVSNPGPLTYESGALPIALRGLAPFYARLFSALLHFQLCMGDGRVARWCWINFQCWGVLLIWMRVGQGPTALAIGAGGGCLDIFSLIYHFSFLSPSLWGRRPDID